MSLGPIVVDACVLLNLVSTGQEVRLIEALGAVLIVPPRARAEARFLDEPPDEMGIPTVIPANLVPLEAAGFLEVREVPAAGGRYADEYSRCRALTKVADAECLALAGVSGFPLATDDKRQRHLFSQLYAGRLLSTLELLRAAEQVLNLAEEELRAMLEEVFRKGGYRPPREGRGLPLGEWYRGHLEAAGLV